MPNPFPTALRARAVHAYEAGAETYEVVAERFDVGVATLQRWVRRQRTTGTVTPLAKGGGWTSPIDGALLRTLVNERPDQTTDELTRAYNQRAAPAARVHRSSVLRALQRLGYVFKKNDRGRQNSIVRASKTSGPPFRPGRPR
jgi:transposase